MKIKAVLDTTGAIKGYATVGDIVGSTEIEIPDNTDLRILPNARWDGEKLVEISHSVTEATTTNNT